VRVPVVRRRRMILDDKNAAQLACAGPPEPARFAETQTPFPEISELQPGQ
jgi:hypothetical protein